MRRRCAVGPRKKVGQPRARRAAAMRIIGARWPDRGWQRIRTDGRSSSPAGDGAGDGAGAGACWAWSSSGAGIATVYMFGFRVNFWP